MITSNKLNKKNNDIKQPKYYMAKNKRNAMSETKRKFLSRYIYKSLHDFEAFIKKVIDQKSLIKLTRY